ncbi:hypothetical protein BAU22_16750 [Bacillus sp. 4048]|uniref:DMT family transporter n=1 Tax=Bacillus TaxID=1386 RepID=UPI0008FE2917|nr:MULTISPECIES: DMT family transporter [Bacillus]OJD46173.1 hypothetical protein BAU22_16750 [Bacillus sp. 4048]
MSGILGWAYVLINVYLIEQIGDEKTGTLALFGQITSIPMAEKFGLFNSLKNRIKPISIFSLIVMMAFFNPDILNEIISLKHNTAISETF